MNKTAIWIQASRPKTLIATLSPFLIGTIIASSFSFLPFLMTLLTGLSLQIGINFANDYYDHQKGADTSRRRGPTRVMQAELVTKEEMRLAMLFTFSITALSSLYLTHIGGSIIGWTALFFLLAGIFYTAGPYPLAYLGLGDLFVITLFGPVATLLTTYLQTHAFSFEALLVGLAPGCLANAILTNNNLRDEQEDRLANKKTLVVRFGTQFGKHLYLACLIVAFLTPIFLIINTKSHFWTLLASASLLYAYPITVRIYRGQFISQFPKTARLQVIYTLAFILSYFL